MEAQRLSMSPLKAPPSPHEEKPEEPGDGESVVASQTDPEQGGPAASAEVPTPPAGNASNDPATAGAEARGTPAIANGMEDFQRLRRRLLISTLLASSAAVPICWLLFDRPAAISLLVGALAGLLYLVLLARSVARLGGERRSVSKVQLLVPIVLVLASARLPQLEIVPALVGFLLYKPALLVQAYLDR